MKNYVVGFEFYNVYFFNIRKWSEGMMVTSITIMIDPVSAKQARCWHKPLPCAFHPGWLSKFTLGVCMCAHHKRVCVCVCESSPQAAYLKALADME